MFKKLLCALAMLALLPAALAEGFVFDGAITWNASPQDAQAYLGDATTSAEDMGDYGVLDIVARDGGECLGFDCGRAEFVFYDGDLFAIYAYFTGDSLNGDIHALADRLSKDYGEPNPERDVVTLDDLINGVSGESRQTVFAWTPGEDTIIELHDTSFLQNDDGSAYLWMAGLVVTNKSVSAAFDRAMEGYLDEVD